MIIAKKVVEMVDWVVYHQSMGNKALYLNTTAAN
jgi:hypothetical protein